MKSITVIQWNQEITTCFGIFRSCCFLKNFNPIISGSNRLVTATWNSQKQLWYELSLETKWGQNERTDPTPGTSFAKIKSQGVPLTGIPPYGLLGDIEDNNKPWKSSICHSLWTILSRQRHRSSTYVTKPPKVNLVSCPRVLVRRRYFTL